MLRHPVLSLVGGSRLPVYEDEVPVGGDMHDLHLQIRCRLTGISDELFYPVHPWLWMEGRMVVVVISEILMHDIEIAPHGFLASVLHPAPDKRLVFFLGHGTSSFLGNDGDAEGFMATIFPIHRVYRYSSGPSAGMLERDILLYGHLWPHRPCQPPAAQTFWAVELTSQRSPICTVGAVSLRRRRRGRWQPRRRPPDVDLTKRQATAAQLAAQPKAVGAPGAV